MEQVEVRARQLSGRHQISSAGFHLVDGVPFGTRPLRPLSRPSVAIPPRKRRRISTDETGPSQLGSVEPGAQLSIANVDNNEQQLLLLNSGNATLREESADVSDARPNKRAKTSKTVHFGDLNDDEDDDEDDGDFSDFEDASSSDSSSDSESDESSSDSDSSKGEAPSEESLHQQQEKDTWEGFVDAPARPRDSAPPYMVSDSISSFEEEDFWQGDPEVSRPLSDNSAQLTNSGLYRVSITQRLEINGVGNRNVLRISSEQASFLKTQP